ALAARKPAGLQSLVLLAPSPPTPEPIAENDRKHLLETHGSREAAVKTVSKAAALKLPSEIFKRAVRDNLRSSEKAWRAWLESESRTDISAKMPNITAPVLVLSGENDETIKKDLLEREVVKRLEKSKLTTIPQAGHLLPLEVPEMTAKLIAKFVNNGL
ncbi:MAG: alpha/beta hydrolase, partial [Verrucomicrobiota bacterium]|nr:alpha/beta hydrolase [Verrucomicrobiota bacterium]